MYDFIYAGVRASAKKGDLLTHQQLTELTSSKDIRDLVNRLKDRYPILTSKVTFSVEELEELLLKSFRDEVDEFIGAAPKASHLLRLVKRESDEEGAIELLKQHLNILQPEDVEGHRRAGKEDAMNQLAARGFGKEAADAMRIYEKYKVPGLIDVVFERDRIMAMFSAGRDVGTMRGVSYYLKYKVDVFNTILVLRGIRNGIDKKAIEELLIPRVGTVDIGKLSDALKQSDVDKAVTFLESIGVSKVESARMVEKAYEEKIPTMMTHVHYRGYLDIGAVLGYLELKLAEITNIVRIANAINRKVDMKAFTQDLII